MSIWRSMETAPIPPLETKGDGTQVLLRFEKPIDFGGYGPEGACVVVADLHRDWWGFAGSAAARDYPIKGAIGWLPIPEGDPA